ncbi:hypothetical protein VPH35_066979 [Triticum aestivum]
MALCERARRSIAMGLCLPRSMETSWRSRPGRLLSPTVEALTRILCFPGRNSLVHIPFHFLWFIFRFPGLKNCQFLWFIFHCSRAEFIGRLTSLSKIGTVDDWFEMFFQRFPSDDGTDS